MHPLVKLAKLATEIFVKEGKIIELPDCLPDQFYKRTAGVFVTIEKARELRACIGTYLPNQPNIAKEVIRNAVAAASQDYRFGPLRIRELSYLSYTVYVLGRPEQVRDYHRLDPQKFGVMVKTENGQKSGLLLPGLPGIESAENQFYLVCQKAGINQQKEKILIYRFTAEKYHE